MEYNLGITTQSDNIAEEYIYTVGKDGHIPLVLLVLQASGRKDAVERYLSIYAHTKDAQKISKELRNVNPELTKEVRNLADIFDERDPVSQKKIWDNWQKNGGMPIFEDFPNQPKDIGKYFKEYPKDTIMDFSIYASSLATYMTMLTPEYDGGHEGVPQACSMNYIAYYQREEFTNAMKAVETAFNYVLSEIMRIMKLRNIDFDENDMTVILPSYKAVSFRKYMYPGF